jgi:hypothetical protein
MTKEYLEHPIVENLEDHSSQLREITRIINNLEKKFNLAKRSYPALTEKQVETMEFVAHKCLRKAADLSMSRGEIQTDLQDHYTTTYIKSPAMGKKLFLDHYFSLHKPYDKVKDKCWKLIMNLAEYKEQKF